MHSTAQKMQTFELKVKIRLIQSPGSAMMRVKGPEVNLYAEPHVGTDFFFAILIMLFDL